MYVLIFIHAGSNVDLNVFECGSDSDAVGYAYRVAVNYKSDSCYPDFDAVEIWKLDDSLVCSISF